MLLVHCNSNRKTEREEEVESSPSVIINKEKERQQFDFSSCRDNRCEDACVWARLGWAKLSLDLPKISPSIVSIPKTEHVLSLF